MLLNIGKGLLLNRLLNNTQSIKKVGDWLDLWLLLGGKLGDLLGLVLNKRHKPGKGLEVTKLRLLV